MGYFDEYHIFRDPIHGYIKVYDIERDIINSLAFQRLRRIKQLGPTNLVYHGADHTRFAHSLGVMELATRVFDTILHKDRKERLISWNLENEETGEIERKKILLRLAALLHDMGHAPLSHATENNLFLQGTDHRIYSKRIILEDPEIKSILDKVESEYGIKPESIAGLITRELEEPILQPIIDGPLDADKMDYLWRDSFYTGVHYGRFDLDRLINTLTIVYNKMQEEKTLGIEEGGIYSAEAIMLARYFMFLQVYFHAVRRVYDLHYAQFIRALLRGHDSFYPVDIKQYLEWDDSKVLYELGKEYSEKGENYEIASIIFKRQHYKMVYETRDFARFKEEEGFKKVVAEIKKKWPNTALLTDNAKDAPNKFKKEIFYVKLRNPKGSNKYAEIDSVSVLIEKLDDINKLRVYCPRENFNEIKTFSKDQNWEP